MKYWILAKLRLKLLPNHCKDNLKVLVGGQFPVHNFKKIFLLFVGSQIGKYLEYKEGLLMQIESFPLRKPNRKDEAKIFTGNGRKR